MFSTLFQSLPVSLGAEKAEQEPLIAQGDILLPSDVVSNTIETPEWDYRDILGDTQGSGSINPDHGTMFMSITGDLDEKIIYSEHNWGWFILWIMVLTAGYAEARIFCDYLQMPYDCLDMDPLDLAITYVHMTIYGIAIYWIGNIVIRDRDTDSVLNKLKKIYFYPIVLGIIPAFSYLGNMDGLKSSLSVSSMKDWPVASWIVYMVAGLIGLVVIVYHFNVAWKTEDDNENTGCNGYFGPYVLNLVIFLVLYTVPIVYVKLVEPDEPISIEIHHWFLFWFLALFTKFNTWVSITTQALCIGIFIQGFANYGPDFIYYQ